jgi:4-hydroxy-4-methyl-2-oxoglutarate aldolase
VAPHRHPDQGVIVESFERPSPEAIALLADCYTGLVLDHLGKYGAMHVDLAPLQPGMRVVGPATTSLGPDLTVRRAAIDLAQSGDVLVVAAGGIREYACFGDGTAHRMQLKGMSGAVIDGSVRDLGGIRRLGFPTFARGVTARNYHYPASGEHGAVNVPVVCGGILVNPGDLIVGDDDGIVVVPRQGVGRLAEAVHARLAAEREERSAWTEYPAYGVRAELESLGYRAVPKA